MREPMLEGGAGGGDGSLRPTAGASISGPRGPPPFKALKQARRPGAPYSLAKHKRRKSEPTRDTAPAREGAETAGGKGQQGGAPPPPPAVARPTSRAPPTEQPGGGPKKGDKAGGQGETIDPVHKAKLDRLFWVRVGVAVVAGVAATFIFEPVAGEERRWASIGFMIVVFIATVIFGKSMNIRLPPSDRKKLVTQGIGSYIFLYLFMWIVSYTLVNMPEAGIIASPIP